MDPDPNKKVQIRPNPNPEHLLIKFFVYFEW
jgi:hypothetical protein